MDGGPASIRALDVNAVLLPRLYDAAALLLLLELHVVVMDEVVGSDGHLVPPGEDDATFDDEAIGSRDDFPRVFADYLSAAGPFLALFPIVVTNLIKHGI